MLEERASDVERIDVHFKELRSMIRDFGSKHKMFYPGLFDGAPSIPRPELLTNCRVLNNRLEIIRGLPQGGVFAEIGTMYGDFIVRVLEINQPEEVHIFDYGMQNISAANKVKLDAYGKIKYHVGDSSSNLASLPDEYFDVIYIDADHSFRGVWKDLMQAIKKIKADGYIVCNDYTNFDPIQVIPYGVYAAVNKFANEYNFRFEFLALSSMGFHDVALRRC